MSLSLRQYRNDMTGELQRIISFWKHHAIDKTRGGFFGRIDHSNHVDAESAKGSVLNARILWFFSAAYKATRDPDCVTVAQRAFNYIKDHFIDKQFGGVYWTVTANGEPLDTKKQVYALAFALYGCSEYYKCQPSADVLACCKDLFSQIEQHSFDKRKGGYFEAFAMDWKQLDDLRLSDKDANEKKTMNTHLHILESYSNYYSIQPDQRVLTRIIGLLNNFLSHVIDWNTGHLGLFFDENWHSKSGMISYGHDIEASWLLMEAADKTADFELINRVKDAAAILCEAVVVEGLDADGGLWYEKDHELLVRQKHWWPQAEAMVGFFNAWQFSGNIEWLNRSVASWEFVKRHILDTKNGEWFWGIDEDGEPMQNEDKIGLWKCPYHNGRACLEIINRIDAWQTLA